MKKDGNNELRYLARKICRTGYIGFDGLDPIIRVVYGGNLKDKLRGQFGRSAKGIRGVPRGVWTIRGRPLLQRLIVAIIPHSMRMRMRTLELLLVLEAIEILDTKPEGWEEAVKKIKERLQLL